jgi:phosphatidylglycerophosphatase A
MDDSERTFLDDLLAAFLANARSRSPFTVDI